MDHQDHSKTPREEARRIAEALGNNRASSVLLSDLTRHPGFEYLKQLGETQIELLEGKGFAKTADENFKFGLAGNLRKLLRLMWETASKDANPTPTELAIIRGINNQEIVTVQEIEVSTT
jgi:hypothetical protein